MQSKETPDNLFSAARDASLIRRAGACGWCECLPCNCEKIAAILAGGHRTECMTCGIVMREGNLPVSHSICPACEAVAVAEFETQRNSEAEKAAIRARMREEYKRREVEDFEEYLAGGGDAYPTRFDWNEAV